MFQYKIIERSNELKIEIGTNTNKMMKRFSRKFNNILLKTFITIIMKVSVQQSSEKEPIEK